MTITDDEMNATLAKAREYTVLLLRGTPKLAEDGARAIVWEHGRRNMEMRAAGVMPIICPINDGSEWSGIAVFTVPVDEARKIMDDDPGVLAGLFTYEVHTARSFPGAQLPG